MPYVSAVTNRKLTGEEKRAIKSELGRLIALIPGKSEARLMVSIQDDCYMAMRGSEDPCAYVQAACYKSPPEDAMRAFVEQVTAMLEEKAAISPENVYITFSGKECWGTDGQLMT